MTAVSCATDGRVGGSFPVRGLNREFGGPNLAGCGLPCEEGSEWSPVWKVGGVWRARLASCRNALLCDFCATREQRESVRRWGWHFGEHLDGGGSLVRLDLSLPHGRCSDWGELTDMVRGCWSAVVRSGVLARLGVVDWVSVLHQRVSRENGPHPHLHVQLFSALGVELDAGEVYRVVAQEWYKVLRRVGYRKAKQGTGVFARRMVSVLDALYGWSWADDEPSDQHPQQHLIDDHEKSWGEDQEQAWGGGSTMSTWELARLAITGDAWGRAKWKELVGVMHGRQIVSCSRRLDEFWAFREAEMADDDAAEVEGERPDRAEPELLVANKLVTRAVGVGCWNRGLRVGERAGPAAAARVWAEGIGCTLVVGSSSGGVPMVWMDDSSPPGRGRVVELPRLGLGSMNGEL